MINLCISYGWSEIRYMQMAQAWCATGVPVRFQLLLVSVAGKWYCCGWTPKPGLISSMLQSNRTLKVLDLVNCGLRLGSLGIPSHDRCHWGPLASPRWSVLRMDAGAEALMDGIAQSSSWALWSVMESDYSESKYRAAGSGIRHAFMQDHVMHLLQWWGCAGRCQIMPIMQQLASIMLNPRVANWCRGLEHLYLDGNGLTSKTAAGIAVAGVGTCSVGLRPAVFQTWQRILTSLIYSFDMFWSVLCQNWCHRGRHGIWLPPLARHFWCNISAGRNLHTLSLGMNRLCDATQLCGFRSLSGRIEPMG